MGSSILRTPTHVNFPTSGIEKGFRRACFIPLICCLNSPLLQTRSPGPDGWRADQGHWAAPGLWEGQKGLERIGFLLGEIGKSILLSPLQAQAGPETCQETQSQQLGSQLTTNPTPSPMDTSPRRPPGPVTSPTSPSLSSPGKRQPGPGVDQGMWLQCPLLQLFTTLLLPSRSAG